MNKNVNRKQLQALIYSSLDTSHELLYFTRCIPYSTVETSSATFTDETLNLCIVLHTADRGDLNTFYLMMVSHND